MWGACVVGYICGWLYAWSATYVVATCVVGYMCSRLHVCSLHLWWATYEVSYMCDWLHVWSLHVWSATCVIGYMCSRLHVWLWPPPYACMDEEFCNVEYTLPNSCLSGPLSSI